VGISFFRDPHAVTLSKTAICGYFGDLGDLSCPCMKGEKCIYTLRARIAHARCTCIEGRESGDPQDPQSGADFTVTLTAADTCGRGIWASGDPQEKRGSSPTPGARSEVSARERNPSISPKGSKSAVPGASEVRPRRIANRTSARDRYAACHSKSLRLVLRVAIRHGLLPPYRRGRTLDVADTWKRNGIWAEGETGEYRGGKG